MSQLSLSFSPSLFVCVSVEWVGFVSQPRRSVREREREREREKPLSSLREISLTEDFIPLNEQRKDNAAM